MNTPFEDSKPVTKKVVELMTEHFGVTTDERQVAASVHPLISNAMFKRDQELLEQERMETLIALSRVLDNESIIKAVTALHYSVTVKPYKDGWVWK